MKRYAIFVARFAMAPMISGTFVVSTGKPAAPIEWAHAVAGFAMIYMIVVLLLRSIVHRQGRAPAAVALAVGLMEAIPGMPRLHAALSPVLFATLVWASVTVPHDAPASSKRRRIWILPALVLTAIFFGVGYRHQTSSVVAHIGFAMLAAGLLLGFCMMINEKLPPASPLRGFANLAIAAVLFQVTAGIAALVIRMLEINGGLALGLARTAHIAGAGPLLAASVLLAIQYRRVPISYPPPPLRPSPQPSSSASSSSLPADLHPAAQYPPVSLPQASPVDHPSGYTTPYSAPSS
jgi:hypothetical protein